MQSFWIYPIYTAILGIILISIVPRAETKRLAIYSIIFGGVGDFLILIIFKYLLNIGIYINFLPFGTNGMAFFPPIAWTIWFIIYFYFLPENQILQYIYIATAAAYSTFFANVLVNLNIIKWDYERVLIPFFIYLTWFATITWIRQFIVKNSP